MPGLDLWRGHWQPRDLPGIGRSRARAVGAVEDRREALAFCKLSQVFAKFRPFRRINPCDVPLMPERATDRTIVALLAARDSRAMELAYDRWGPLTYTIALHKMHQQVEAENVVQEAFLQLWRNPELALLHYDSLSAVVSCDARLRSLKSRPLHADTRIESDSARAATEPTIEASGSKAADWLSPQRVPVLLTLSPDMA